MQAETIDERTLRRYLLGDVSPQECEEIELWLMSDDEAYDLVLAAEDDLIDDSLRSKLSRVELHHFSARFLVAPERRRKLDFGRSFKRLLDGSKPGPSPKRSYVWGTLAGYFNHYPALGYAFYTLFVLMVIGGTWSAFKVVGLERELRSTNAQLSNVSNQRDAELRQQFAQFVDVSKERDTYRFQLDDSRSSSKKLEAQIQTLERAMSNLRSSSEQVSIPVDFVRSVTLPELPTQMVATFNLFPGTSRGSGSMARTSSSIPTIPVFGNSRLVQFFLRLLLDNYDTYRAALIGAGGEELWTSGRLVPTVVESNKVVVVLVSGKTFSSGSYSFRLSGVSNAQPTETITNYYFRVASQ